ncbi:MAG: hypothetical protein WBL80_05320 [Erysipelotrichaceae bacterium]
MRKTDLWKAFIALFLILSLSACQAAADTNTSPTSSTNAVQIVFHTL